MLDPRPIAVAFDTGTSLLERAHAAGLVDVDATAIVQFLFFLTLVLVLPKLIFEPLLKRFDQRSARTEGARAEARRMLKEADEQVVVFERAMADEKQRAMAERAAARMQAQRETNDAIAKVRRETNARIESGIEGLRAQGVSARAEIDAEAKAIAGMIVTKIIEGRS
ncbi:MAG: synthase [Pseudomonadota bacterium]|jgi:F0F1-type ATP synthase membrane subunit b/b'